MKVKVYNNDGDKMLRNAVWNYYSKGKNIPSFGNYLDGKKYEYISQSNPNRVTFNVEENTSNNKYDYRNNVIKNNQNDLETIINLSEYPTAFGTILYDEGFLDHAKDFDINKKYIARNGETKKILGNFGLDYVTADEINASRLPNEVKQELISQLKYNKPFDNTRGYSSIEYLTPYEAAAIIDVKMKNAEDKLINKFGSDNLNRFYGDNNKLKYDLLRVAYRKPAKINQAQDYYKSINKNRSFETEPLTIEEFYNFLNNVGGKNQSLSQSEYFRTLTNEYKQNGGVLDATYNEQINRIRQPRFAGWRFKDGGIYIKEENRGKFTEQAQRAGMTTKQFTSEVLENPDKYSPTTVKRARFSRNIGGN